MVHLPLESHPHPVPLNLARLQGPNYSHCLQEVPQSPLALRHDRFKYSFLHQYVHL